MVDAAEISIEEPLKPEHPVWVLPTRDEAAGIVAEHGVAALAEYMRVRNERIRAEEVDPLNHTMRLPTWWLVDVLVGFIDYTTFVKRIEELIPIYGKVRPDVAVDLKGWLLDEELKAAIDEGPYKHALILGGNASAKTEYMCHTGVSHAAKFDKSELWLFHMSERMSIDYHQTRTWQFLPQRWKDAGKAGRPAYVGYKSQTGFSDNTVTGPNASKIMHKNYQQDEDAAIEGGELGDPLGRRCLGYACDELVPQNWLETLRFRLSRRTGAVGMNLFTPKYGYSETVAWFLDGARMVRAEMGKELKLPKLIPLVRVSPRGVIVNFHSRYNLFPLRDSYDNLVNEVKADTDEIRAIRIYGHAEETRRNLFKRLNKGAHLFKSVIENGG